MNNEDDFFTKRYKFDILRAAMDIKMGVDGSYDTEPEHIERLVFFLQDKLDNWRPTVIDKTKTFDALVKAICEEAISYYKGSWIEEIMQERNNG